MQMYFLDSLKGRYNLGKACLGVEAWENYSIESHLIFQGHGAETHSLTELANEPILRHQALIILSFLVSTTTVNRNLSFPKIETLTSKTVH